jgi:hypothetical protein
MSGHLPVKRALRGRVKNDYLLITYRPALRCLGVLCGATRQRSSISLKMKKPQ